MTSKHSTNICWLLVERVNEQTWSQPFYHSLPILLLIQIDLILFDFFGPGNQVQRVMKNKGTKLEQGMPTRHFLFLLLWIAGYWDKRKSCQDLDSYPISYQYLVSFCVTLEKSLSLSELQFSDTENQNVDNLILKVLWDSGILSMKVPSAKKESQCGSRTLKICLFSFSISKGSVIPKCGCTFESPRKCLIK